MKGIRFYRDWGSAKGKRTHVGPRACIAVLLGETFMGDDGVPEEEAFAALTEGDNQAVCSTGVSSLYLEKNCTRISQQEAYDLHPRLFDTFWGGENAPYMHRPKRRQLYRDYLRQTLGPHDQG